MEKKQNDMFMTMLANLDASFETIVTAGLNPTNTSLLDKSVYANNKYVQELMKNSDGDFDKVKFDKFYDAAKMYYNNLAVIDYNTAMLKLATYHRDSIIGPLELTRKGPMFLETTIANPYEQVFNLTRLGRIDEPTKSVDELAQSHKVLANPLEAGDDLKNAKWEDSPNDNFFGNFFDTLVMAQWDSDGTHTDPITGEKVEHKKGDLKTNQDGEFYYEKLAGRDVYGRRVLNKMNVLTTDGSFWNRYDFFDSDDINLKSIGGSILKNAALVGTMFIPYVGPWVTGLSVATLLAGLVATFGKMLAGSDSKILNNIEGWAKSLNRQTAKSQYAQENTWCWENFIDLAGDTMGLLKEQRFVFERIPSVIKGTNPTIKAKYDAKLDELKAAYKLKADEKFINLAKSGLAEDDLALANQGLYADAAIQAQSTMDSFVKGYQKLGEILSKGYMTGITVADTYGEAKNAGASDMDATLLTLGYAAGEYALLNTGIGEWILPELRADKYKSKAIVKALASLDEETKNLKNSLTGDIAKESKKDYVKKLFNIGKNIANAEYANGTRTLKATLAAGAGEGIEEVTEELLADFSKGCYDVVKWLQGSNTRLNTFGYDFEKGKWDSKEILDRYGMSLVGGALGGSLANAFTSYKTFKSLDNMTSQLAILELVYMSRNGGLQDFVKQVDKMQIANSNLSATDFEIKDGLLLFAPGTKDNNQDLYVKTAIKLQVQMILDILDANGASLPDERFLSKQTLNDLRFNALHQSTTAGAYLNEFNTLSSKLVKLESLLNDKRNASLDSNKDGVTTDKEKRKTEPSDTDKLVIKNLESEIKDTKQLLQDLVNGKRSYEFIADSLFEMTTDLSKNFTTTTFPLFAENKYGKKFSELTENEKAVAYDIYKEWKSGEGRDEIRTMSGVYRDVAQKASEAIKRHAHEYSEIPPEVSHLLQIISNLYSNIRGTNENEWLEGALTALNETTGTLAFDIIQNSISDTDFDTLKSLYETDKEAFKNKYEEIVLDNIGKYLKPLIDSGVATTEVKNQLNTLLSGLKDNAVIKMSELEDSMDDTILDIWSKRILNIQNLLNDINSLKGTAFEKNLDEFSISIGKDPINISTLITRLNASFNAVSNSVTLFNMDELLYKDLTNAIDTIKLYEAAIKGARTDSAGVTNYFGYNATLNEINKKSEVKHPELAEIDSKTADIFIADIDSNLNKLLFLKLLYQINQGLKLSKLDRVSVKKDLLTYKNLKAIVQVPDDDKLRSWDGFLELKTAIEGMSKHENALLNNLTTIEDKEAFEKETIQAEDAIYDFFLKNADKLNDVNKLAEFVNPKRFQLYTLADDILNEELDNLDGNSMLWWIASRAAVKSSDFYNQYKLIIDPDADKPLAPVPTLEMAVYMAYASVMNGNLFTKFFDAARLSLKNDWSLKPVDERKTILSKLDADTIFADDKYVKYYANYLPVPKYSNSILIEGIAGSGKSSAVLTQVKELLNKFNKDILSNVAIVHGASKKGAEGLKSLLGIDSSTAYDRTEFLKYISSEWKDPEVDPATKNLKIADTSYGFSDDNEIISTLGVNETSTYPSLIIIDEISLFSTYDVDLINDFAKKYGITFIVAGDFSLSRLKGSHPITIEGETLKYVTQLERTSFIRTPKLGVSMRTDNSVKTHNLLKMIAYMHNPTDEALMFDYYEDETGIYGEHVIAYDNTDDINIGKLSIIESLKPEIAKMVATLKDGEKIGYIYNDESSPIFQLLSSDEYSSFIDFKEGVSAQGLESQYYIVEATPDPNSDYLNDVYTGITRSLQGSIVIAPINYEHKLNSKQVDTKINEAPNTAIIKKYALDRKKLLETVVPTGNVVPYTKRTTLSTKAIATTTEEPELEGGIDPMPPPTPEPTPEPIVVPPTTTTTIPVGHDYAKIELSDVPEELRSKLKDLENEAISNPVTDRGYDVDDSKTDLKYGTLVKIGDKYGAIIGVKHKADDNYEYAVRITDDSIEVVQSDGIESIIDSTVKPPTIFSHENMVSMYGESANIEDITINIGETKITLPLDLIPFENKDGIGTNNIVKWNGKYITLININGVHVPFYLNESLDSWIPFFGISENSISEGASEDIQSYYNSNLFQNISQLLNETIGLNPKAPESNSTVTIDAINLNMDPIIIDSDTFDAFNSMVTALLEKTDKVISDLLPEALPPRVPPLIWEDNIAPITDTTLKSDADLRTLLDDASSDEVPKGGNINELMELHSFNTTESGVLRDEHGNIVLNGGEKWNEKRIDSMVGLMKIDRALGNPIRTFDEYDAIIAKLRNAMFNIEDKNQLNEEISDILGIPNLNVRFALQSTPYITSKKNTNEFAETKPSIFSKGRSEEILHNGSTDTRSLEWKNHCIVATVDNGKLFILNLPLLTMSSPFTLILTTIGDGIPKYPDMLKEFINLTKLGKTLHEISLALIDKFHNKYPNITNLFKLYNFTSRSIYFIKDKQWTIAKGFTLKGPWFYLKKGYRLLADGLRYEAIDNEEEWVTVDKFRENPLVKTTGVLMSLSNDLEINGKKYEKAIQAGHPFVLVSYDLDLSTPEMIVNYYLRLVAREVPKKVLRMYIIPPKATIKEYIENLNKIFNHQSDFQLIGDLFTSYNLIKSLLKDSTFCLELEKRRHGALEKVKQAVAYIDSLVGKINKKNALYEVQDWTGVGLTKKQIAGLFDGAIMAVAYDKNTLGAALRGGSYSFTLNEHNLSIIENALHNDGIDSVRYNVKIPKDGGKKIRMFNVPLNGYEINGLPFKIHGKIDSYTFVGLVDWLVLKFLNDLHPSADGRWLATIDTASYMNNTPLDINPDTEIKNKMLSYIDSKLGYSEGKIKDFYNTNSVEEANKKAADFINANSKNLAAIIINGELKITNKSDVLGNNVVIYDNTNSPITDISHLADINGHYKFTLESDGKKYDAEYDGDKLILVDTEQTIRVPDAISPPENLQGIISYINESPAFEFAFTLKEINEHIDDLAEFLTNKENVQTIIEDIDDAINEGADRTKLLQLLDYLLSLLNNEENTGKTCKLNIIILF